MRGLPVEAQSADGVEVDAYPVSAVDLVDGPVTLTCSPAAPHGFRLGETAVDCTASDGAGNKATASFKVTVEDNRPPELPGDPGQVGGDRLVRRSHGRVPRALQRPTRSTTT